MYISRQYHVLAKFAATKTILSDLPERQTKEDALKKKTRLAYKKNLVETRRESYGIAAPLEKKWILDAYYNKLNFLLIQVRTVNQSYKHSYYKLYLLQTSLACFYWRL